MNQRGSGKLGCLMMALLGIIFVFISYRIIPVYLDKIAFEEDIDRIVSKAGASNMSDQAIRDQIEQSANVRGFQVGPEDIRIARSSPFHAAPEVKIEVYYARVVEFPGYIHTFRFDKQVSTFIGRL